MILPVAKLGSLLLKTISKPIAIRLKIEAAKHERFRQLIISMAQANHRITTNIQRRLYGHATDVAIRPLNEEKAVQAATDLIGELFVFVVAGGAVVFEVQRSARSEARKEELRRQELEVEGIMSNIETHSALARSPLSRTHGILYMWGREFVKKGMFFSSIREPFLIPDVEFRIACKF